jgi:hypothetical protein
MRRQIIILLLALYSGSAFGYEKLVHVEKTDITKSQLAVNFATKYVLQWSFFYAQQRHAIEDHGSFRNWRSNMFSPHFDRDNLETNLIQHSLAGATYYLYYRSKGYSETRAFLWANLSSIVFEFTIETFTERPSYQDLALTATMGTALGLFSERVSLYFHEKKVWPGRLLGFVFNPFSALPHASYEWRVVPVLGRDKLGANFEWRF